MTATARTNGHRSLVAIPSHSFLSPEDRAIFNLLASHGPLSCAQVVERTRWKVGPTLVSLERRGLISYTPGRYCEPGRYSITEKGETACLVGGWGTGR